MPEVVDISKCLLVYKSYYFLMFISSFFKAAVSVKCEAYSIVLIVRIGVFIIAAEFFHKRRTEVQCLHRWQKVLNPDLIKGPWTLEV